MSSNTASKQGLGLDVGDLTKARCDRLGMTRTSLVWHNGRNQSGIRGEAEGLAIPGSKIIEQSDIAAGPDSSIYAYVNSEVHANLFRIQLR